MFSTGKMGNSAKIFRIILEVADLNKAAAFYAELLSSKGRIVGGGRCYFDSDDVILALLEAKNPQKIPQYIYFSVNNLNEIHARAKKLDCLSTEMVHGSSAGEIIKRPWGELSFYAQDPYGNGLCFVDEKSVFAG